MSKTWNGPQDGLPPAGTVCEINDARTNTWEKVHEILAHTCVSCENVAVFRIGNYIAYSPADRFRPIRTPEQIAAEEREKAISEMFNIYVDSDTQRKGIENLYDAGFRKQPALPAEDMTDWRNWKVGDCIERAIGEGGALKHGKIYKVDEISSSGFVVVSAGSNSTVCSSAYKFRWHSRPSA